jgi:caffeoyl-CoA O-methyltransferase
MSRTISELQDYFRQFVPMRDELLVDLEREAEEEGIPIVGPVVGKFLYILARLSEAARILELGTATGYSALHLARACKEVGGRLLTLEQDPKMAARAQANFRRAGLEHLIEIRVGEAVDLMASMADSFDLIFLDIDKGRYTDVLPHCERLLRPGGLLVADNISFERADRFNREIFASSRWEKVYLLAFLPGHSPENDGLSLALRIQ